MNRLILTLVAAVVLAACATAPTPLQGQFSARMPDDVAQAEASGEHVRWGGHIVQVNPQATRSCFEIVGYPLDGSGRPLKRDRSEGRFLACRTGFYDPEVFQAGRDITIAGTVEGFETRKVGDYDYRYARVAAEVVYLWPVRRDVDVIVQPAFYYGWWR